jgi:Flp pilus assembly CpaF family ATPase
MMKTQVEVMKARDSDRSRIAGPFSSNRLLDAKIQALMGEVACRHLVNPSTQELSANYDPVAGLCRLFIDDGTGPMRPLDAQIQPSAIIAVTRMLATLDGQSLPPAAPFLSCNLANGFRWHSVLNPVADGPQVSIRAHPRLRRPLTAWMTKQEANHVVNAILARETILIAGGTSSGKTTMINSIIDLIPEPERLVIIEDTPEIQPRLGNVVRRFTTKDADLKRHVKESLRSRPDRIIIGETRGAEALDLLDAAVTGHCGLSSIHANSCDEALTRIRRLAGCDKRLVREAINLVLHIQRFPDGRRLVTDIRKVNADT